MERRYGQILEENHFGCFFSFLCERDWLIMVCRCRDRLGIYLFGSVHA